MTPRRPSSASLWIATWCAWGAFAIVGCQPDSAQDAAPAQLEEQQSPGELKVREFEAEFKLLRSQLARSKDGSARAQASMRLFVQNAKLLESTLKRKLLFVEQAEKELLAFREARERAAVAALQALEGRVQEVLDAPAPDPQKATALVDGFSGEQYRGLPEIAVRLDALRARIDLIDRAAQDVTAVKERVSRLEDPVKIIAILEGLDGAYDSTSYGREVQTLIKENYRKVIGRREVAKVMEAQADWVDVDLNDARKLWPDEHNTKRMKGGMLEIGPNPAAYAQGDNPNLNLAVGTCVQLGEDDWIDVEIVLEAQIVACDGIIFGARGHEDPDGYYFSWRSIKELAITDDGWHKIKVRIEDNVMSITDLTGLKETRTDRLRAHPGPFGIRVCGEKAVLRVKSMRAWVKKRASSPEGSDAGAAKDKDDKKPAKKGKS